MLHEFLTLHREDIIARTRAKVATRIAYRVFPGNGSGHSIGGNP